jgi:hypothetical protein
MKVLIHCANFPRYPEVEDSHRRLDTSFCEVDWLYTVYNPFEIQNWQRNIPYKLNKARVCAIALGYDYLFNVEWDIILPHDALYQLLRTGHKVISGLYRLRPSHTGTRAYAARIWDVPGPQPADDRYIRHGVDFEFGDIVKCTFVGFGCILFHRTILQAHEFLENTDVAFAKWAQETGVPLYVHTGVKCIHLEEGGKPLVP